MGTAVSGAGRQGESALVIGGTGPSGPYVVQGLVDRGFETTILHSGAHEPPEIPDSVEHIHTDAYDSDKVREALGDRTFDVAILTYGRLRANAEVLKGRVGQFISCLLYTSPSPRDQRGSRMPSSA